MRSSRSSSVSVDRTATSWAAMISSSRVRGSRGTTTETRWPALADAGHPGSPSPPESTNWHYPLAGRAMLPGWHKLHGRVGRFGLRGAFRGLEREREGLLEQFLHARQELGAVGAVEDAVVADEREDHLVARHELA